MSPHFYERPILNSPYAYPACHWELDEDGQPTDRILESRRRSELITPVPQPKKRRQKRGQREMVFDEGKGLSTEEQQYDPTPIINEIRSYVDSWRNLPNPNDWQVSPETARLLAHWRHHQFEDLRPFFCQVEAIETAIWLTEVAPKLGKRGEKFWDHIKGANEQSNPELIRLALKLATGAGKTTVMAMLIAWQTVNAVRHPNSKQFSRGFLIIAPGITIRDRLRVLLPNDPDSYYKSRELVPADMLADIDRAKIVITNYHAFKLRERIDVSKGTRAALEGWRGETLQTLETEGQMIQRVMPELMGLKNVVVLNDEAHHCYRERPLTDEVTDLKGEEKDEAKKNNEAARLWISGIEAVKRKLGLRAVYDLSATPFFLRGSGYAEGTLFPWTVSDFSLMDAIECGIVKLPRVPVADNVPGGDTPKFRNLWEHIGKKLPKKGRGSSGKLDPLSLPVDLLTALDALYGHYKKTFELWEEAEIPVPPVFIVVCNNTATSKLVYDYVSGFHRENDDGSTTLENGRLALFQNFDEYGNRIARPRTLLIDSEQLEVRRSARQGLPRDGGRRDRAFSARDRRAHRRHPRGRRHHRSGPPARGHEHRRQERPSGRAGPLRRLRLDADRGLGHEHRHAHSRRPGLRHAASLRAGRRPRPAPPILRSERGRPVQRRVCRRARHSLRLRGEAGNLAAGQAARDGSRPCREPGARRARNPLSARRGLPGRAAGRAAYRPVRQGLGAGADAGTGRARRSPRTRASSARASI